jgi:hypothetical protein
MLRKFLTKFKQCVGQNGIAIDLRSFPPAFFAKSGYGVSCAPRAAQNA